MGKSKLVQALNIRNPTELRGLMMLKNEKIDEGYFECIKEIVFEDVPYKISGEKIQKSKHAIYEMLKLIFYRKYGKDYQGQVIK